jgi:hypothetical protein
MNEIISEQVSHFSYLGRNITIKFDKYIEKKVN